MERRINTLKLRIPPFEKGGGAGIVSCVFLVIIQSISNPLPNFSTNNDSGRKKLPLDNLLLLTNLYKNLSESIQRL